MRPDHVLHISLNFDPSHGHALAKAFRVLGYEISAGDKPPQIHKPLATFDPETWEEEVLEELEPLLGTCRPTRMFVEHSDGSRAEGVIIHRKTWEPSSL